MTGCPTGDINRPLIGGTSSQHGLVEVCVGGDYYPVSVDTFSVQEAAALCRSTGLGSSKLQETKIIDIISEGKCSFRFHIDYRCVTSWFPFVCY